MQNTRPKHSETEIEWRAQDAFRSTEFMKPLFQQRFSATALKSAGGPLSMPHKVTCADGAAAASGRVPQTREWQAPVVV